MDNRERSNLIEKIKTVILVVLFLVTILLLYFFWKDMSFGDVSLNDIISPREEFVETIDVEDVIVPTHIDVCLDNGTYTKIEKKASSYWNEGENSMQSVFRMFVSSGDEFIEEITEKQYDEVMEYISAKAVFDYYLPFRDYCTLLGVSSPAGSEMIGIISEAGFSSGSYESMFIYDAEKDKYYRIVSDVSSEAFLNEVLAMSQEENTTYFPLESFVGENFKREILVPAYFESTLKDVTAKPDFGEEISDGANDMARSFFSGTFDFVRRIQEENGRVIFIYGYGEKTLTIDIDGSVSYKADVEGTLKPGYFDALKLALATISQQGGFATADGSEFVPYILSSGILKSGNGYSFEFGALVNGEKSYYYSGCPLRIVVENGQVSRFERKFVTFGDGGTTDFPREAHSAINVLAQNYDYIYERIMEESIVDSELGGNGNVAGDFGKVRNEDDKFAYVASVINDISYGYVYDEEEGLLRPCYVISTFGGALRTYFDLYTAEPLDDGALGIVEEENGLG